MPTLLRDRNFALLFGGETINELGSSITYLAFPLIAVAVLRTSGFETGVVAAAGNAAWLFVGLPAGVWVDRVRRRPLLIGVDVASAVLLGAVPVLWTFGLLNVAVLAVVGFLIGALSVVFDVAYPAFLPSVVASDRLIAGNGLMEASANGARVAGPGVGGILIQLIGAPAALLADAASFLVSAATIGSMRVTEVPADVEARPRFRTQVAEGLRYVVGAPVLRAITAGVTNANLVFGGYVAVLILFLNRQLGLNAGTIGLLTSIGGIGGIVGSLVAGRIADRIGDARLLWASAATTVPSLLMIPLTTRGFGLTWFVVGELMLSASISAFNVCARATIQSAAPAALLGRVTASMRLFSRGALPVGALAAGALASATSPRIAIVVMVVGYGIAPLWLWASPIGRVRTIAELKPPEPTGELVAPSLGAVASD